MIEVSSFGDMLQKGSFKVHSRFEHVTNFVADLDSADLVSLVDDVVGPGPFNIVVNHQNLEHVESLFIDVKGFNLAKLRYDFEPSKRYDSFINMAPLKAGTKFYRNLINLEESITEYAHPKSLAFLLDEEREKPFKGAFEKEFVTRIKKGIKLLFGSDPNLGIKILRGLGFGLTPSGDDFIAGFFIAKHLMGSEVHSFFREALGKNPLSNSFLKSAEQGRANEELKKLIHSLFEGDKKHVKEISEKFMNHGATSGADMLTGLVISLKEMFCENKRHH